MKPAEKRLYAETTLALYNEIKEISTCAPGKIPTLGKVQSKAFLRVPAKLNTEIIRATLVHHGIDVLHVESATDHPLPEMPNLKHLIIVTFQYEFKPPTNQGV